MAEGQPNAMNLDLNLGPVDHPSGGTETRPGSAPVEDMNLDELLDGPARGFREAVRRRQRWRSVWRQIPVSPETRNIALELINGNGVQTGEGSVSAEDRPNEMAKMCESNEAFLEVEALGKKEGSEKSNGDEGSFFDCHICLDLAKDPVVTCCGHLFCWPCLYRWLHVHSDAKECPVCKGEVNIKNVTPIFGRGNCKQEPQEDTSLKIPPRPQGRRVESWRQTIQRTAFTIPMEEMIRRLGSRFDLSLLQQPAIDGPQDSSERSNSLLHRILTSRGMRREQSSIATPQDAVDLTDSSPTHSDTWENRRLSTLMLRRSGIQHAASISNLTSALSSAERLVESYFRNQPSERNQEQPPPVDDRDSVSSIAAVIHSESQTMDTAIEIDSNVSLSTSSSRRRNDTSRISDVDSGDSRPPRRRRLN